MNEAMASSTRQFAYSMCPGVSLPSEAVPHLRGGGGGGTLKRVCFSGVGGEKGVKIMNI